MKVLHYSFGKDGGAEVFFVRLVNALAKRGVEQKVVMRPGRSWRSSIADVADIVAESNFRSTQLDRITLPLKLQKLIREWQPDAVLAWMARAGQLLPNTADCLRFGRLGDYPNSLAQFKNADLLICNTPGIVHRVRELGWRRSVEVISNFTNCQRAEPFQREQLNTPHDVPLVCAVGRLVARKGFDTVVRAMARVPEAHLWIVGDGKESQNLKRLANELGVASRVRFAGWQSDPRPYLAAGDVSVMASSHEPLGNVILESWGQRVPVVSTSAEGPTWLIDHEQNGLLVDVGDQHQMASAMARIISDPQLAASLVVGGDATLQSRFSEDAVVDRYLRILGGESLRTEAA